MKVYNPTYSLVQPPETEITEAKVFIASDVQEVIREFEDTQENCYQFILTEYDKDEYLKILMESRAQITALQEELQAAKILLGVE